MRKNAKVSLYITDIPSLYTGYVKVWWNFECTRPGAPQKEWRDLTETRITRHRSQSAAYSSMIEVFPTSQWVLHLTESLRPLLMRPLRTL